MASTVDPSRVVEFVDSPDEFSTKMDKLADLFRSSKYTVFFTGAGVSTSSGVGDYRGPSGAWTKRRIKELQCLKTDGHASAEDLHDLELLLKQQEKELQKSAKKVDMQDAEPSNTHMAMATLIRNGLAQFVITTNLDGLFRKAGLKGHEHLCCLHGDIYIERCTGCGYDFERNYHTRQPDVHVHDHSIGKCSKCGSAPPKKYNGYKKEGVKTGAETGFEMNGLISTTDKNMGTKDTHINFGELLDDLDWHEADEHCRKADLCVVAGTSIHITHFPFLAKRTVIINLQPTPDDKKADLRIWATCDDVFNGLLSRLGVPIDPVPIWHPRDAVPISQIPANINSYYIESAKKLSVRALLAGGLLIGNSHEIVAAEDNAHRWCIYMRPAPSCATADLSALIQHIDFQLHDTFSPPTVRVSEPPFEVARRGWGTFTVKLVVKFRVATGLPTKTFKHTLNFEQADTSAIYPVV